MTACRRPHKEDAMRTHSTHAPMLVATVLLAALVAAPAWAQPQDGPWTGTTGQDRSYTFTVINSGTQIRPLSFGFALPGCTGSVTFTNPPLPIEGSSFARSVATPCFDFSTSGVFTSPESASGTLSVTAHFIPGVCSCSGAISGVPWTAAPAPPPPPTADLALAMTDGRSTAVPGAPLAYTLTVTNNGPSAVSAVTLTDTLPPALQSPAFSPSAGSYDSVSGAWNGLALAAGQSAILTLSGTVNAAATGTITNSATVSPAGVDDPNPFNNSASDTDTLTPQANLAITKAGPGGLFPPSDVAYVLTVTNLGPSHAAGATVSDTTPAGLTFVSNAGHCTTSFPCSLGPIPAGERRTITATFNVPGSYAGPDPVQNTASVSGTTPDPDPANNSWTVASLVNPGSHRFFALTPCRLVDTRGPVGPRGGPALNANQSRNLLLAGTCGVPSTARAVALNVTAVGATSVGNLRLYPGGFPLPLASVINYQPGRTRANNTVALLGAGGDLNVRCDQASGTVHLILDVFGYYE